jgi:hypothetical protein
MSNKERSQKKINAFFGIVMVDLVILLTKRSNAHLIFKNVGQRKKSKKNIKNSIKKMLKKSSFFSIFAYFKVKTRFFEIFKV